MENSELAAVKQDYTSSLADLTINSKPVINTLTMIAGENIPASSAIVEAIEERLQKVPALQKLPTLYLIDSILKNIKGVYVALFQKNIVDTFTKAYYTTDAASKKNFLRVLTTWQPIFPGEVLQKIQVVVDKDVAVAVPVVSPVAPHKIRAVFDKNTPVAANPAPPRDFPQKTRTVVDKNIVSASSALSFQIYGKMSLQCTNCGFRYPENDAGREKMKLHLDSHYRKNRRMKEKNRKAISRDWFVSDNLWANQATVPKFFEAEQEQETVIIVTNLKVGDMEIDTRCPVCSEKLDSFYDKDQDEWMFSNVKKQGNRVVHAGCVD